MVVLLFLTKKRERQNVLQSILSQLLCADMTSFDLLYLSLCKIAHFDSDVARVFFSQINKVFQPIVYLMVWKACVNVCLLTYHLVYYFGAWIMENGFTKSYLGANSCCAWCFTKPKKFFDHEYNSNKLATARDFNPQSTMKLIEACLRTY